MLIVIGTIILILIGTIILVGVGIYICNTVLKNGHEKFKALSKEEQQYYIEKVKKESNYSLLVLTCFFIPIVGFISGPIHIDSNNSLAKKCLSSAFAGIFIYIIIVLCIVMYA